MHAGLVQEVALKHKGTGVIGHNAFREIPLGKICKYATAAAGGGLAVAEVMQGNGPKDVLTVIKAADKAAGGALSNDAGAVSQASSAIHTMVKQLPSVGNVAVKSVMDVVVSGIGKCLSPHVHMHHWLGAFIVDQP